MFDYCSTLSKIFVRTKLVEFELGWKLACFPSSEVLSNPLFTFLARVKSIRYNYHHHSPQGCWAEGRNSIIWTIPSFSFYSRVTEMQIGFYWSCYSSPPSMMRPICHWHQNLDNPNFRTIFSHYVFFIVFPLISVVQRTTGFKNKQFFGCYTLKIITVVEN